MEIIQASGAPADLSLIEEAVDRMEGIETLPAVAQRLLSLTADPDASFADIEALVGSDPALTARVLQAAASPLYGGKAAPNLGAALVRLGLREVRNLALAAAVSAHGGDPFQRDLWGYALGCAVLAETLAEGLGRERFAEPFVSALLHELGTMVIAGSKGLVYKKAVVRTIGSGEQAAREQELYGFTHCDIGALAAERWHLFEGLAAAIQFHHDPETATALEFPPEVVATVRLVALVAAAVADPGGAAPPGLLEPLGLDQAALAEAWERARPRIEEYRRLARG